MGLGLLLGSSVGTGQERLLLVAALCIKRGAMNAAVELTRMPVCPTSCACQLHNRCNLVACPAPTDGGGVGTSQLHAKLCLHLFKTVRAIPVCVQTAAAWEELVATNT